MDRKEFLSTLGLGAAALACAYCLDGCKPLDNPITAPANIDFTLDLTSPANAPLTKNGGYVYQNGIIIARTTNGSFVALSQTCTHAGGTVEYIPSTNLFYCPNHGSDFTTSGAVARGPASSPLQQYTTVLTGNTLRVHS